MTTENNTTESATTKSVAEQILSDYKERVNNSSELVRGRLVDVLVNREVDERVALLDSALKQLAEQDKELKKLAKPDLRFYNTQTEVVQEALSEKKAEELKKAREQYTKLSNAFDAATSAKPDFNKLRELQAKKQ